jgi:predicted TIM-barrel fold metal-dependent hydrolase
VRVVDCHVQLQTRTYFEAHVGKSDAPAAERDGDGYVFHTRDGNAQPVPARVYDPELQLEELESQGVDVAVATSGPFALDHLPRRQATELAMHLNEERAELERRFPGRLHALAMLPMQDAQAAIETVEHAIRTLGMRGVTVAAGGDDRVGSRAPVFRRIAELGVPLFLQAAASRTVTGAVGANPTLTVVHSAGGDRLPCLRASAAESPDRLLFGSGYPYGSPAEGLGVMRKSLAGAELTAALSGNAITLLGLGLG